jgi:hypothetical protein
MSLSADSPEYPLGLDLGPVALGSWVIAEGFCLHRDYLTLWYSITGAPWTCTSAGTESPT